MGIAEEVSPNAILGMNILGPLAYIFLRSVLFIGLGWYLKFIYDKHGTAAMLFTSIGIACSVTLDALIDILEISDMHYFVPFLDSALPTFVVILQILPIIGLTIGIILDLIVLYNLKKNHLHLESSPKDSRVDNQRRLQL